MTFETALRLTEILLGFAIAQQSAEHLVRTIDNRPLFALRLVCAAFLMTGLPPLPAAHLAPSGIWSELFIAYLGVQLILSYFISGQVKIINPAWRSGAALADVFAYSAYPVGQNLRALAQKPRMLLAGSWAVIGFEVLFPLALLHPIALLGALTLAAIFHFSNACLFGLNRFFWAWISAFPSLIWLQGRIFGLT